MPADPGIYRSERMAASYASHRPPVHGAVCRRLIERISPGIEIPSALDAGCGAGASTAALLPHAESVVGLDPYARMLSYAAAELGQARFVQGWLESMPFADGAFQLVTAAGALNYTEVPVALAEVCRVLKPEGWFAAYDFSPGCRLSADSALPQLYAEFRKRFPASAGYALDLKSLPYVKSGLEPCFHMKCVVEVEMSLAAYVGYLLGDSGVEIAIAAGVTETGVRDFCTDLFAPAFQGGSEAVVFDAELAVSRKGKPLTAPALS